MNYTENTYSARVLVVAIVLLLFPIGGWAQAHPKTSNEILDGLLGGERAPGGMRQEKAGGAAAGAQGRIALPIHFEYNSAQLSADSAEQLHNVAQALNDPRLKAARIRIEGHTDNKGSHEYNQRLSQARAGAVERYLIDKEGVDTARLDAEGFADSHPLPGVSPDTEEGRAANRRVEFVNLSTADTAAAAAAAPAAPRRLSVDVRVNYKSGGQVRKVAPGAVLRTSDNYRVSFTPTRDGYVYVYQIDSSGDATSVYPNSKYSHVSNPVKGKQRYTVPDGEAWLALDNQLGSKEIVVLGTEHELTDPKAVVLRLRNDERGPAGTRADLAPETPEFTYRLPFQHQ
jgi:outer membrane protein OmpA-like peptidoglycan-associated protein